MAIKVKHEGNVTSRAVASSLGGEARRNAEDSKSLAQMAAQQNMAANRPLGGAHASPAAPGHATATPGHATAPMVSAPRPPTDPERAAAVQQAVGDVQNEQRMALLDRQRKGALLDWEYQRKVQDDDLAQQGEAILNYFRGGGTASGASSLSPNEGRVQSYLGKLSGAGGQDAAMADQYAPLFDAAMRGAARAPNGGYGTDNERALKIAMGRAVQQNGFWKNMTRPQTPEQEALSRFELSAKDYMDRADKLWATVPEQAQKYWELANQSMAQAELIRRGKWKGYSNGETAQATGAAQTPRKVGVPQRAASAGNPPAAPAPVGPRAEDEGGAYPVAARKIFFNSPQVEDMLGVFQQGEAIDYDTKEGQAAVARDVQAGNGEYVEDGNGDRTIRIGNWDYLSDEDKEAVPETHRENVRRRHRIDLKAIHEMQKKANEARAEFDKKRKAEEDRFRKTFKGQNLTPTALNQEVAVHMTKWDEKHDPATIRRMKIEKAQSKIDDAMFSGGGIL